MTHAPVSYWGMCRYLCDVSGRGRRRLLPWLLIIRHRGTCMMRFMDKEAVAGYVFRFSVYRGVLGVHYTAHDLLLGYLFY